MHSKISIRSNYTTIFITLIILLLFNILITSILVIAQEQELTIHLKEHTLEANGEFEIVVKDENENTIEGATVYIQSVPGSGTTNEEGRTWLIAPNDRNEITIIAQKEGYQQGTTTVRITMPPSLLEQLMQNPYFPIAVAVILLISAIVFVNIRQKNT